MENSGSLIHKFIDYPLNAKNNSTVQYMAQLAHALRMPCDTTE